MLKHYQNINIHLCIKLKQLNDVNKSLSRKCFTFLCIVLTHSMLITVEDLYNANFET